MMDNVALLIDWENIKLSTTQFLMSPPDVITFKKIARTYGQLKLGRAYANWSDPWHGGDSERIARQGIEPVFALTRNPGGDVIKNLADFRLVCDAMEVLFTNPQIQCFVIASGDGALDTVISKLSAHGRRVVRVAVKESLSKFRMSSMAERVLYDDWVQWTKPPNKRVQGALSAFQQAVERLEADGRESGLPAVKAAIREVEPEFEEEKIGIGTFRHLAYLAEARGLVVIDSTRGEPALALAVGGGSAAGGHPLPKGATWTALINILEEETGYARANLVRLLVDKGISANEAEARNLIEVARLSDVLWLRPNAFFKPDAGRAVKGEQFMLNVHHPRVQVARSLRS